MYSTTVLAGDFGPGTIYGWRWNLYLLNGYVDTLEVPIKCSCFSALVFIMDKDGCLEKDSSSDENLSRGELTMLEGKTILFGSSPEEASPLIKLLIWPVR